MTTVINPWLIAVTVTIATFMELLDTSIANVSLPHIAGGLAVSYDESKHAFVEVPAPGTKSGRTKVPVKLGVGNGTKAEVVEGLKQGDKKKKAKPAEQPEEGKEAAKS